MHLYGLSFESIGQIIAATGTGRAVLVIQLRSALRSLPLQLIEVTTVHVLPLVPSVICATRHDTCCRNWGVEGVTFLKDKLVSLLLQHTVRT